MNIDAIGATDIAVLSDDALIDLQRDLAAARRTIDAHAAAVAAEIDHRSRRELGYDGLAQRRGARTADALVQQVTGFSRQDARALVRVGTLVTQHSASSPVPPEQPWLAECAAAVAAGRLSIQAADVIRAGLGVPDDEVTVGALAGCRTPARQGGHRTHAGTTRCPRPPASRRPRRSGHRRSRTAAQGPPVPEPDTAG
jgi:hypothetical protein